MPKGLSKAQLKVIDDATNQFLSNKGALKENERINGFARERKAIDEFAAKKNPLIREYINIHKEAEKRPYTKIGRMVKEMRNIAAKQEILKTSAENCKNEQEKQQLLEISESLNQDPAMIAYEKYIKGLKYLAGMTNEVDKEVEDFFAQELRETLPLDKSKIYEKYRGGIESWEADDNEKESLEELSDHTNKLNEEYQKSVAALKARDMFAKNQVSPYAIEAQFVGEGTIQQIAEENRKNNIQDSVYRNRLAPSAFCVGRMLAKGYSIEKILDPRELQKEKKEVGQEYLQHRKNKDYGWYVDAMYENGEHMINAFQKYVEKHKAELKTEQDLAMHGNTLGMLAYFCFDHVQELQMTRQHSKKYSQKEVKARESELGKYMFGVGMGGTTAIEYELPKVNAMFTAKEITRQLCIKRMLEEMQKDKPDFSRNMMTIEEWGLAEAQVGTIGELNELFGEDGIDPDELNKNEVKTVASMMGFDFINKNNIRYDRTRVPATTKNVPENLLLGELLDGQQLDKVVSRDGKQLIETDVPVRWDLDLKSLEKKNLRGKESGNSKEFNELLRSYDETRNKLGGGEATNAECLDEMANLKKMAVEYIKAKREQKGYHTDGMPDTQLDETMMGHGEGSSIFSSRGKDRYDFAVKMIDRITKIEEKFRELEVQKDDPEKDAPELGGQMEI